jgi:hypothetical protein
MPEVMLAQEEAVINRGLGIRKGVEGAFGMGGESEGTLVLTDKRLVYVHGNEKEVDLRVGVFSQKRLFISDVEDLSSMSLDSMSFEIPISTVTLVAGHGGEAIAPKLEVKWTDQSGAARATEFVQQITGGSRRKNLNDWAEVVEKLRRKQLKIMPLPPAPSGDSLEGRILGALGDMQEKGLFTIESELEERFGIDLDPEEVEEACGKLVAAGLVRSLAPPEEDPYYRKVSPLGDDDLGA